MYSRSPLQPCFGEVNCCLDICCDGMALVGTSPYEPSSRMDQRHARHLSLRDEFVFLIHYHVDPANKMPEFYAPQRHLSIEED